MQGLVHRKELAKETPTLYLIYGYREIEEPNRWYVGSCLYMREQARDDRHRKNLGDAKKFHEELLKIAKGRCFDELVQKVVLEVVWGNPQGAIDRENIHIDRLDSIQSGFNCQPAGMSFLHRGRNGRPPWNKGKKGKKHTDESRLKISNGLKGRHFSADHRRKLSEAKKGRLNPRSFRKSAIKNTLKLF